MYLSDIIRDKINLELEKLCVDKVVTFCDTNTEGEQTIKCKSVKFGDDDGNCWINFTDDKGNTYIAEGQGIDVWFEVND